MIAGIFVGGKARRMGGRAKGLLPAPCEEGREPTTVIARLIELVRERCSEVLLVGRAEAYVSLGVPVVEDAATAPGEGPLAGLVALLDHAGGRSVLAFACDMPYVTRALVARLVDVEPDAPALAPRDGGKWSPLFARYDSARVAAVARDALLYGTRSLQPVLDACGARELVVSPTERALLRDWDEPSDVDRRLEG